MDPNQGGPYIKPLMRIMVVVYSLPSASVLNAVSCSRYHRLECLTTTGDVSF